MAKIEKIKDGDTLWDVSGSGKNKGYYPVTVLKVNVEEKTFTGYWNGNIKNTTTFIECQYKKFQYKEPS